MHANPVTVLWVYIVLLVVGGMMGFLKAKSKISLIMSLAFAAALSACQLGYLTTPSLATSSLEDILLLVLLLVFVIRLLATGKFMPAGLMTILTLVVLVLRHV